MKTDEKDMMDDLSEDMLRDLAVLDRLKKESAQNYLQIMSSIRKRHIRRIFLAVAGSCAAVAALILTLVRPGTGKSTDMLDAIEIPTLITDAGKKIPLGSENSYTLDLQEDEPSDETGKPVARPSDTPDATVKDSGKGILNPAASIRKSTVAIPQGYTYNILFDDGTEAYINSGSYIEFPKSFEGRDERRVALKGEGYFKVAKSDRPFIVTAGDMEIKVYGTEFNVNTNKEGRIETILVSGSVGVRSLETDKEIMMSPDEMLTYDISSHDAHLETVDPHEYLAWMRGDFTYNDRPLSELLEEIETFYGIDISKNPNAVDPQVTISLSRKLGHRQIIEILEYALGIEFIQTGEKKYECKTNFN